MTWWSDIDINLTKKLNGDIKELKNVEAVKESIKNIFKTMQGSRRMLPGFAINLYNLLFEPVDRTTASEIGKTILNSITSWDDRPIIQKIIVVPNNARTLYDIKISFTLKNYKSDDVFEIEEILYAR